MWLLVFLLCFLSTGAIAQPDYIPPKAFLYKDQIKTELNTYFPDIPDMNYIPALIEHESCISLTHSRCWSPTSRLKSAREEGAGLPQITRAYNKDGSLRFDTLSDMKNKYKTELKEASWATIYQKPNVQIRVMILLTRDNYKKLYMVKNDMYRLHMTDPAYNGGVTSVQKQRRACGLVKGCDPGIWFNNVENFCTKSKKPLYAGRSAYDIFLGHPRDVFGHRLPKYRAHYFTGETRAKK